MKLLLGILLLGMVVPQRPQVILQNFAPGYAEYREDYLGCPPFLPVFRDVKRGQTVRLVRIPNCNQGAILKFSSLPWRGDVTCSVLVRADGSIYGLDGGANTSCSLRSAPGGGGYFSFDDGPSLRVKEQRRVK